MGQMKKKKNKIEIEKPTAPALDIENPDHSINSPIKPIGRRRGKVLMEKMRGMRLGKH